MQKTILISFVTFIFGMFVGGMSVVMIMKRPKDKEEVRAVPAPPIAPVNEEKPVIIPKPVDTFTPVFPAENAWIPSPGDRCLLMMPQETAMGGDGGSMYVIPYDVFALTRFIKYVKARDGKGLTDLLHERRGVWTDNPKVYVTVISVASNKIVAEVRVQSDVYKVNYREGRITKEDSEKTSGIEAVVPLDWLSKNE